jgi:Ca-activated chloride channel family protein
VSDHCRAVLIPPLVFLLVVCARPAVAQAPSGPPEFRTEVSAVYVDAFVTRGGRPLPDLRAADFELRDNGVPQKLELLSASTRPLSAVMVFDTSSSMEGDRLEALRAAGEAFLDALRPADQAALVAFNEDIVWLAEATRDKAVLRRALSRLLAGGATAVFDALYAAILLSGGELQPLVVLFTDGEDNRSWLGPADLRLVAERSNTLVHVVAWRRPWRAIEPRMLPPVLSESSQERTLREIAEASGGRYWNAGSPRQLREAFGAIADAMGHRYVLRYEPNGVASRGWHRIEARLRGVKGHVHARRGYWVGP